MKVYYYFLIICCAACNFTPIYQQGKAQQPLQAISVVTQDSREGQLLRTALEDMLMTQGAPDYRLNASIGITAQPISIEADGTTRRFRLNGQSTVILTDLRSNEQLYTTNVQRISSYNISDADYSTYIAGRDAREQVITALADTIRLRLLSYMAEQE